MDRGYGGYKAPAVTLKDHLKWKQNDHLYVCEVHPHSPHPSNCSGFWFQFSPKLLKPGPKAEAMGNSSEACSSWQTVLLGAALHTLLHTGGHVCQMEGYGMCSLALLKQGHKSLLSALPFAAALTELRAPDCKLVW